MDLPHNIPVDPALLHHLDGYDIIRHSAHPWNSSGGFCDVFLGDHSKFGKVALKRPRISGNQCTPNQLRSFREEAKIWKELQHPNVLQFMGMILSDGLIWLISVFAENGTLSEYILKHPSADRYGLVV